jgi:aconitate hydratase
MGVLPCNFKNKDDYDKVKDQSGASFRLLGISNDLKPMSEATLRVKPPEGGGAEFEIPVIVRIDTPIEIDYYRAGGILPYVLAQILRENGAA